VGRAELGYSETVYLDDGDRVVIFTPEAELPFAGAMIVEGRRCALLKDTSIDKLPTDFVGHIYEPIDLDHTTTLSRALHKWLREDLGLGPCSSRIA
jgi:hypothetical protein